MRFNLNSYLELRGVWLCLPIVLVPARPGPWGCGSREDRAIKPRQTAEGKREKGKISCHFFFHRKKKQASLYLEAIKLIMAMSTSTVATPLQQRQEPTHKSTNEPGREEDLFCGNVISQNHGDTRENKSCFFLIVFFHKEHLHRLSLSPPLPVSCAQPLASVCKCLVLTRPDSPFLNIPCVF